MKQDIDSISDQETILIVDDTPENVSLLTDYLEGQGFRILVAQDGEEGLQRADVVKPDLILMDVMMPGLNGFDACRRLKQTDTGQGIPVIFMTALNDSKSVICGFDAGGVDYITKPIHLAEVLARVKTHLALRAMHKQVIARNLQLQNEIAIRMQTEEAFQKVRAEQQSLIDRLREAHDQLLQSEKLASIGQLAAGIAHEINNPIGFVNSNMSSLQGYFETLLSTLNAWDAVIAQSPDKVQLSARFATMKEAADIEFLKGDIADLMTESMDGLKRVKDIVQSLKDFSHVGESNWVQVDLHRGIDSTLNIVNNEIKYKAKVIKEYGSLPEVKCLASQLNQVFMNLFVNAAHAIKEFGTITIRTGCTDDWVWVEISDTGSGIPAEIMNRIFDPFFTTKPVGTGTGLGLSLSYGIVNNHGGRIEVRSEVDHGTCFTVHLPVNPANAKAGSAADR